ncbi:diguanylate cyclase [Psychromonas sp.]|uniref:diguanylate cyclase n=1 Tax=Psychromonas sp. TaxID=1884585 RepID=UPI003566A233
MLIRSLKIYLCLLVLFSSLLCAKELKQVTLQPAWFEQFQFAGYYIAKEKGFYNDVGLAVEIKPFDLVSENNIAQQVHDGQADFAVGKETLILERAHNKKIVILYALFQSTPLILLSTKESQINTIDQFTGKKVMAGSSDAEQVSLKAMLNSNGVALKDLIELPHSHNIMELVNKKTDIMSAYISKTPYELEKMGVDYNVFAPQDYGFDMYSDFLYTSEELIAKDITTVKAFKEASLKGWQYAFANMPETVDLIFAKYNQQNLTKEALLFEGAALKKLSYLDTDVIGTIDQNKLQRILDLYRVLGVERGDVDFSQLIFDPENPRLFLTQQEKAYLSQKQKITICIDPNWLPYEAFDKDGKHIGLNTEFINIFRKQLPVPIEIVPTSTWSQSLQFAQQRKCDLLSLAVKTDERKKYLNFTSPYLVYPRVLVTKPNLPFIDNFTYLADKKIAIPKGYAQGEIIRKAYPKMIIVEVESIKEGLEKVAKGELYGFIGGLSEVGHLLQEQFIGQLKVSGKFDQKEQYGIGVRNDEILLLNIFQKLVDNLSEETRQNIVSKSAVIKYEPEFDYEMLWWLLFILFVVICAFLYRQSVLNTLNKKLNEKVAEKTKALQELNESLERKIKERTRKIERSKEILQNVAFKDNLTDIFNRHYLFEASEPLLNRANEFNEPLSLLLIDIDHFKKVNDTYGHLIGDNILKFFVVNIQKVLRTDDIFVRYGGEEFVVLLPKVNIDESLIVAEKLRRIVEQDSYRNNQLNIPITISIGVSQYQHPETLEKLISRADLGLYRAKQNGRNQVQKI